MLSDGVRLATTTAMDLHHLKYPNGQSRWVGLFDGDYNKGRQVVAKNFSRCSDRLKRVQGSLPCSTLEY
jgi:hypothetical protein